MKTTSFTPTGASARVFQPRLWLAVQPEDQKVQADGEVETPCLWALLVFNGGPALRNLVVEVESDESDEASNRFEIPELDESSVAHLFGGGPSDEPPHGTYRVHAETESGAVVSLAARFTGLVRPAHMPAFVADHPCFPLAPGASWQPQEYVEALADSYLRTGVPSGNPASLAFSRRISRLMRGVDSVPSDGAAREIIWSAVRNVFGAEDSDLELPFVRDQIQALVNEIQELADFLLELKRPISVVPSGEISFALVPGEEPALYLLNTFDTELRDVSVQLQQLRWKGRSICRAPRQVEIGNIAAGSATLIAHLDAGELDCDLECIATTGPLDGYAATRHRSYYPEGELRDPSKLVSVELLDGLVAEIRRTESSAVIEPTDDDDSGRLAA